MQLLNFNTVLGICRTINAKNDCTPLHYSNGSLMYALRSISFADMFVLSNQEIE